MSDGWYFNKAENYYSYKLEMETEFIALDPEYQYLVDAFNKVHERTDISKAHTAYKGKSELAEIYKYNDIGKVDLPPGQYVYEPGDYGTPTKLTPTSFRQDQYVPLPAINNSIITDINEFIQNESIYRNIDKNMCYKMGTLLYGDPGEGKSSLLRNVVQNHLPPDAVTIVIGRDNFPSFGFLNHVKKTLKNRLKVFIFEELTTHTGSNADAEQLLSFLDGENSIDKSIVFATTNYPDLLPGNIVDRPSRIDKMYKISSPNEEERALLLKHYLKREVTEDEITLTKGMSTAYLKEISIVSLIKKITLEESVDLINKRKDSIKSNFKPTSKFGLRGE